MRECCGKSKALNDFMDDICQSKRSSVPGRVENWEDLGIGGLKNLSKDWNHDVVIKKLFLKCLKSSKHCQVTWNCANFSYFWIYFVDYVAFDIFLHFHPPSVKGRDRTSQK